MKDDITSWGTKYLIVHFTQEVLHRHERTLVYFGYMQKGLQCTEWILCLCVKGAKNYIRNILFHRLQYYCWNGFFLKKFISEKSFFITVEKTYFWKRLFQKNLISLLAALLNTPEQLLHAYKHFCMLLHTSALFCMLLHNSVCFLKIIYQPLLTF